jgi:predicted metal-binding protein
LLDKSALKEFAGELGIEEVVFFEAGILQPEDRIRQYCIQNKCGKYGANHMCPPQIGSVDDVKTFLQKYKRGILLQYSGSLDVKKDSKGLKKTKIDFHRKILELEKYLKQHGETEIMGMIGGNCELCITCKAALGEACSHPGRARTSLEALAVDVMGLRKALGLDAAFYDDKITWTGCILAE